MAQYWPRWKMFTGRCANNKLAPLMVCKMALSNLFITEVAVTETSEEECTLDCPHGLVRPNDSSQPVCQCAEEPPTTGCPSMEKCQKTCIYGFKVKNGCERCRCNKCPPFHCKKKCPDGYMYNQRGCKLCKCQGKKRLN